MTEYIQGPQTGKAEFIRERGGLLLECVPSRLAPTGAYVCVALFHPRHADAQETAAVITTEEDLAHFRDTAATHHTSWLHVAKDVLDKLLFAGG
jgi:hypothetical protein